MTDREVMQQALEALEKSWNPMLRSAERESSAKDAITALRTALEQQAEPVAWMRPSKDGYDSAFRDHSTVVRCTGNPWTGWVPLYTTPAPIGRAESSAST